MIITKVKEVQRRKLYFLNGFKVSNIAALKDKLFKRGEMNKLKKLTIMKLNIRELHLNDTVKIDIFGHVGKNNLKVKMFVIIIIVIDYFSVIFIIVASIEFCIIIDVNDIGGDLPLNGFVNVLLL